MNLRLEDIDSRRMVAWVRNGKGSKDRSVPLPSQTLAQLRAYWLEHRPKKWLFPSEQGTSAITKSCVQRCLKATLRQSHIRKNVNCHTLSPGNQGVFQLLKEVTFRRNPAFYNSRE